MNQNTTLSFVAALVVSSMVGCGGSGQSGDTASSDPSVAQNSEAVGQHRGWSYDGGWVPPGHRKDDAGVGDDAEVTDDAGHASEDAATSPTPPPTPAGDSGTKTPPSSGGTTTPPSSGGTTTPPSSGTTTPPSGGTTTPPSSGGSTADAGAPKTPPSSGSGSTASGTTGSGSTGGTSTGSTGSGTTTGGTSTGASGTMISNVELTFYGYPDNSPPGPAIALPTIHSQAGGTGTFADPITFATATAEFPAGTKLYVPAIKRYVIMEDICAQCTTDWSSGKRHIDVWMNSTSQNASQLQSCQYAWTQSSVQVEVSPPDGRPVDSAYIFTPSTGVCLTPGT